MNPIYSNIKRRRLEKGYSQKFMADRLGIETSGYGKLENGHIQLTIERLEQIAKIFEISVEDLISNTTNNTSKESLEERVNKLETVQEELWRIIQLLIYNADKDIFDVVLSMIDEKVDRKGKKPEEIEEEFIKRLKQSIYIKPLWHRGYLKNSDIADMVKKYLDIKLSDLL